MWVGDEGYSGLVNELRGSQGYWNAKKPYVEMARNLGVDEETVRNRIKHMKKSGFLAGWRLLPNPSLLNRTYSFLLLKIKDPNSKQETISRLMSKDGVVFIINYYGDTILITLFDDYQKMSSKQIFDLGTVTYPIVSEISVPRTDFQMTALDWDISRQLLSNAEKKVASIAKVVGASEKTVRRRLEKMMASSAIFVSPMTNLRRMTGVCYDLMIQSKAGEKAEVDSFALSKITNLVFATGDSKNGSFITFGTSNVSQGDEIFMSVKQCSKVESATMNIIEEVIHNFSWLEREFEHSRITSLNH